MAPPLCSTIRSKRSLLAVCWSIVNLLALLSFVSAFVFALTTKNSSSNNNNYYNNNNNNNNNNNENENENENQQQEEEPAISVTSRAMAFAALWTMVISGILGLFGTILLGFQSPAGNYFWCCPTKVHTTNPLSMGGFIGALLMFSNLTLVCSVLFGEFQIRDYQRERDGGDKDEEWIQDSALSRSSLAFSIMCVFLTVLYAGFAALVFTFADDLLRENAIDSRREALSPSDPVHGSGYISSDRFGVQGKSAHMTSEGFVSPQHSNSRDMGP